MKHQPGREQHVQTGFVGWNRAYSPSRGDVWGSGLLSCSITHMTSPVLSLLLQTLNPTGVGTNSVKRQYLYSMNVQTPVARWKRAYPGTSVMIYANVSGTLKVVGNG
jgi:hypothetical protein